MSYLSRIPQEIFDFFAQYWSFNEIGTAAEIFQKCEGQENRLWRTIFKSDDWVKEALSVGASPALVGPKIGMIGNANTKTPDVTISFW